MPKRKHTSIALFFTSIILVVSGILMFLVPYNKSLSSLHIIFGFLLVIILIFHIKNNQRPLGNYFLVHSNGKEKLIVVLTVLLIFVPVVLSLAKRPEIEAVYNLGDRIKRMNRGSDALSHRYSYRVIEFAANQNEVPVNVEVLKGKNFRNPLFAIWMEDTSGHYLKTLYVSKSIYSSKFNRAIKNGDKWLPGIKRRPEALPAWSFSRNIQSPDGYYVPLDSAPDIDGATYATPTDNFMLKAGIGLDSLPAFKILLEVNQAFDWNEYYTKEAFPNDSVYSGDGFVGQPALVYSATIFHKQLKYQKHFILKLEGHSHPSGKNGQIYAPTDSLTTALGIIDRAVVSFTNETSISK